MAIRDSQDVSLVVEQTAGTLRDSQDVTLVVEQTAGNLRESQDVILVLSTFIDIATVSTAQAAQTLAATDTETLTATETSSQAQQSLAAAASIQKPPGPDKPANQLHPLRTPLRFSSRPLTQPGKSNASFTTLLTETGAQQAFAMPLGPRNQPFAGRVFSFAMAGTMTAGISGGSLSITPLYGATVNGVNLGQSLTQRYRASLSPRPWRLRGEIIFRAVDFQPGACLVVCTGSFAMTGDPSISDSGIALVFGSSTPIRVDANALRTQASGALNFAVTFAPASLNASAPTITAKYAFLRY